MKMSQTVLQHYACSREGSLTAKQTSRILMVHAITLLDNTTSIAPFLPSCHPSLDYVFSHPLPYQFRPLDIHPSTNLPC